MSEETGAPPLRGSFLREFNLIVDNQRTLSMVLLQDLFSCARGESAEAFQLTFSLVREARVRLSATSGGPTMLCEAVKVSDPVCVDRNVLAGGRVVEREMRRYEIEFDRATISVVAEDAHCTVVQTLLLS